MSAALAPHHSIFFDPRDRLANQRCIPVGSAFICSSPCSFRWFQRRTKGTDAGSNFRRSTKIFKVSIRSNNSGSALINEEEQGFGASEEQYLRDFYKERQGLRGATEADVIVIGSGLGGLSCAALLARYGVDVLVLESHYLPGGAAHGFDVRGRNGGLYHFDVGPSLFSGLSSRGLQANPLAQVLDAVQEKVECVQYDSWRCYLPEGEFLSKIGPDHFYGILDRYAGQGAVEDWRKLLSVLLPLSSASMALPPASLRLDPAAALTVLMRYAGPLINNMASTGLTGLRYSGRLLGPFSSLVDDIGVSDPFVRNWIDMLCFLLSGVKADGTLAAEVVYMFSEWYKEGCTLEYPKGGTSSIVNALIRGVEKFGDKAKTKQGQLSLGCHVERIVVEKGRATGVVLKGGKFLRARKAVVSNASLWDTLKLIPEEERPREGGQGFSPVLSEDVRTSVESTAQCDSFMHLHLGFDSKLLSHLPHPLDIHHIVVNDWKSGVDSPLNTVLLSIPSVLDPSLARSPAAGRAGETERKLHCLHAYVPATEPFSEWERLKRGSAEYEEKKRERAQVLYRAVERVLHLPSPLSSSLLEVNLIGTPLTHSRFLRRDRGTYGPAILAGKSTFPSPKVIPVEGLLCCGDSTFPGIGVPAVAASGMLTANSLTSVFDHWKMLDEIGV